MKVLVLGGCGIQGRAAVADLTANEAVAEVICADANPKGLGELEPYIDIKKVALEPLDAADPDSHDRLYRRADVVVDLLPRQFLDKVCRAAIRNRVSVVNTNYAYPIASFDSEARDAGIAIMPECGLDPGIDLVLCGDALRHFDEITLLKSYCGGFPEPAACDNPLNYKVSWVFEGVLASTKREGRIIRDGEVVDISADHQHDVEYVHEIDFPGLGALEAIPNGDAVFFTDELGVTGTIRDTGRYALRWPGWSAFWRPLKQLNFLSEDPVEGLDCHVSPYQLVSKLMGPQLQYRRDEKDLVAMFNVFEGYKDGRKKRLINRLLIERDLETGLLAMARGVGWPASIVACMIAEGKITHTGVLTPLKHVPGREFIAELHKRGIVVEEEEMALD